MVNKGFNKRIVNLKSFVRFTFDMIRATPRLIPATFFHRIPDSLQEKILLSTTSVNRCIICARFAAEMAFAEGVSREEVASLLSMNLNESHACHDGEVAALAYAQEYAERDRDVGAAMTARLYGSYPKKAADAIAACTMKSHYYNLMGNTFSAFVSRVKGMPAPGSNVLFEILFVAMASPVVIPSWLYTKLKGNDFKFDE